MPDLDEIYRARRASYEKQRKATEQRALAVSWIRVSLALAAVMLAYFAFKIAILWVGFMLATLAFAWFVREHARLEIKRKLFENLVLINERELQAFSASIETEPAVWATSLSFTFNHRAIPKIALSETDIR